jgi:hypothetical protein
VGTAVAAGTAVEAAAVIPATIHLALSILAACLLWVEERLYPQIKRQD